VKRRDFLRSSALLGAGSAAAGMGVSPAMAQNQEWKRMAQQDLKPISRNKANVYAEAKQAMVSSDHPLSTEAALWALKRGATWP